MRKILTLLFTTSVIAACHTREITSESGSTTGSSNTETAGRSTPKRGSSASASDSVNVEYGGAQPIAGRNENGVPPSLEGNWQMESMEGFNFSGTAQSKLDSINEAKRLAALKASGNNTSKDEEVPGITPPQGPRLHIPERPSISFFGQNETFSGFTGCNKFSGRYKQKDPSSLDLKAATASTKMVCLGDFDEEQFLKTLHRVTAFRGSSSKLELLEGGKPIIVLTKKQ